MVYHSHIKQLILEVETSIKKVHDYRKENIYVLNRQTDKMEYLIDLSHKK